MSKDNNKIIWIIVILIVVGIAVALYFILKNKGNKFNIFSSDCDSKNKGYNKNGILDPRCGATVGACNPDACDEGRIGYDMCGYLTKKCGGGDLTACNPSRPGYDYSGKYNPSCDKGNNMLNCDCSRPGYNLYGDRDSECDQYGGIKWDRDCK